MEASKEGTPIKLDPKTQELYARLEEEKKKNRQLEELKRQNAQLAARIHQLENEKEVIKKQDPQIVVQRTRKKIAVQEQLQEQKIKDQMLETKQKRIEHLIESLEDQDDLHELDSKTIDELKATLDTLIQSRKKRSILIRKLNEQNKDLSQKNENLLFTRDKLAHDLRSLMASILSTLSLFELGEQEVVALLLPALQEKCKVFMDLVVTLSENRIEKDYLYINEIIDLLNLKPEGATERLSVSVTGIDIPIFGDKAALYDVMQNLVNNSVKYSGKGWDQLKIGIEVSQDNTSTILCFSDNGIGIPEGKREQVFELYNRAGIDDGSGKGIGLFMVQKLIEGHKGTIIYNGDYRSGAQFVINLPNAPRIQI
jgi:signal transduction histidine kinase